MELWVDYMFAEHWSKPFVERKPTDAYMYIILYIFFVSRTLTIKYAMCSTPPQRDRTPLCLEARANGN